MRRCLALLAILLAFRFSPRAAQGETIDNDRGLSVSVDAARGEYQIIATDPAWTIGGTTGAPLKRIATAQGTDGVGEYLEISFKWIEENQIRSGSIRLYRSRPIVPER